MLPFFHRPIPISLALRGGDAHRAFNWGVLDPLQAAVTIDGEPSLEGGYSANPDLFPPVRNEVAELLIVWLSPLIHARTQLVDALEGLGKLAQETRPVARSYGAPRRQGVERRSGGAVCAARRPYIVSCKLNCVIGLVSL